MKIQQHTEVLGAILRSDRIRALVTNTGTIEADWFVNATNAWAARLSPRIGGVEQFSPLLANSGGLIATACGFYGTTPDANPLIGRDTHQQNLVHAVGFSGHGLN